MIESGKKRFARGLKPWENERNLSNLSDGGTHTMKEISVKIEKLKNSNIYVATSDDLPELFVMGESADQVVSDIPAVIELIAEAKSGMRNKNLTH